MQYVLDMSVQWLACRADLKCPEIYRCSIENKEAHRELETLKKKPFLVHLFAKCLIDEKLYFIFSLVV